MRIVPQSVPASYSPLLALPAPQIAGLLPAWCVRPPSEPPTIIVEHSKAGSPRVFRSFTEWDAADAEIESFLVGARQRLSALYAEVMHDLADLSAQSQPTPYSRHSVALAVVS